MATSIPLMLAERWGNGYARAVLGILPNLPYVPWGYTPTTRLYTRMFGHDNLFDYVTEVIKYPSKGFSGCNYSQLLVTDPANLKEHLEAVGSDLLSDFSAHQKVNAKDMSTLGNLLNTSHSGSMWVGFHSTHKGNKISFDWERESSVLAFRISAMQLLETLDSHGYYIVGHEVDSILPAQAASSIKDFIRHYCIPNTQSALPKAMCVNIAKG